MYQELTVHIDSFKSPPVWGTEGNDLPLPTLAVGDVLEVPALAWHGDPAAKPVFRVTAVKHVFTDTGPGPEADHLVMVTVAEDGAPTDEALLMQAEQAAEAQDQRSAFLQTLLRDLARQRAPALMDALVQGIRQNMLDQPAHGIAGAGNEWQEAASILQADGHMLADMLMRQLAGSVFHAVSDMAREDLLTLWLAHGGLHDDLAADTPGDGFEPDTRSDALEEAREQLLQQLLGELHDTALD